MNGVTSKKMRRVIKHRSRAIPTFTFLAVVVSLLFFSVAGISQSAPVPPQDKPVPSSDLRITTAKLDNAKVGIAYSELIDAQGGKLPYIYSAKGLPDGLAIRNFSDRISGKATSAGNYSIVVTVTDSANPPHMVSATLDLAVVAEPSH